MNYQELVYKAKAVLNDKDNWTYCQGGLGELSNSDRIHNLYNYFWNMPNHGGNSMTVPYDEWIKQFPNKRCTDCNNFINFLLGFDTSYYSVNGLNKMKAIDLPLKDSPEGSVLCMNGHVGLSIGNDEFIDIAKYNTTFRSGQISTSLFKKAVYIPKVDYKKKLDHLIVSQTNTRELYIGDTLTADDLKVVVVYDDGSTSVNPSGWAATPLKLSKTSNKVYVSYCGLSTYIMISAKEVITSPSINGALTPDSPISGIPSVPSLNNDPFDPTKINRDYPCLSPNNTGDRIVVGTKSDFRWIAVHYTGGCDWNTGYERSAKAHAMYFSTANAGCSANFFVDHTEYVYESVPWNSTRYAWHIGCGSSGKYHYLIQDPDGTWCTNATAIGVEICTCKMNISSKSAYDPDWYFDPQTYNNAVKFIRFLMDYFDIDIDHVIRHYDANSSHKVCPSQFVGEQIKTYYNRTGEDLWNQFKKDLVSGEEVILKNLTASLSNPSKSYRIGDKLGPEDFNVIAEYSNGTKVVNPKGWTALPLEVYNKKSKIIINYENLSTSVLITTINETPFTDVSVNDWFYDYVLFVYNHKIMTGQTADTFGVHKNLTRAEAVTCLYRMDGSPSISEEDYKIITFTDVKRGSWYTDSVVWAKKNGIANGYSDSQFGTNDPIIRQDLMVMLYNYATYKNYNTSVQNPNSYKEVDDYLDISSYAITAMNWGYENKLIGVESDFYPKKNILREEVAAVITRFMNKFCK